MLSTYSAVVKFAAIFAAVFDVFFLKKLNVLFASRWVPRALVCHALMRNALVQETY